MASLGLYTQFLVRYSEWRNLGHHNTLRRMRLHSISMGRQRWIILASLTISILLLAFAIVWSRSQSSLADSRRQQTSCIVKTQTCPVMPLALPTTWYTDRTAGWVRFGDDWSGFSFLHPTTLHITVDQPLKDAALHRIRVGSVMIIEGVSAGLAGNGPADYVQSIYDMIADLTSPDWTHYDSGYSVEQLGGETIYSFRTNIYDMYGPGPTLAPTTSFGLPLQGVIFPRDANDGLDWLIFYDPKFGLLARDILRSLQRVSSQVR